MKKVLAIRGSYQKGNEVIKILEMLGGVNNNNLEGNEYRLFYFICPYTGVIKYVFEENMLITDWETHSLKSFQKEYPYKTFDKLVINGKDCSIVETFWNGFTICYKVDNGLYFMEYSAERIKELITPKQEDKVVDKGKELNTEFNEIYELISDVDNKIDVFYMEHFLYNKDVKADSKIFEQVSRLQMMLSEVKCLSHEIAEYFTWDN